MAGSPLYYASRNGLPLDDEPNTIKEKAEEYAKAYGSSSEQCVAERAYERGANDVLGEILNILDHPWNRDDKSIYENWMLALPTLIRNRIEELRNYE